MKRPNPIASESRKSAQVHTWVSAEESYKQNDSVFGLPEVWILLKRRFRLIATIVFSCTLLALIVTYVAPKTYTAYSAIVLERKDIRPFASDQSLQSLDRDRSAAETEMDVLRSRQFAGRVVDSLNLTQDQKFISTATEVEKIWTVLTGSLRYFAGFLGEFNPSTTTSNEKIERDQAISILLDQFDVNRNGESLAVEIKVSGPSAILAARIANTIAEMYVKSSLEFKRDERTADKERAVKTRGAVRFLRQNIAQPLLVTLRSEEARLQQAKDELASSLGKNHPRIVGLDAQLASVQVQIEDEVQRIILDLEAESLKPSARILSSAEIPASPSFPKLKVMVPAAFSGSIFLAFLLAVLVEATDTRIRSGRRIERLLQVPNLGYAPKIRKNHRISDTNPRSLLFGGNSLTFTEAERSIYMASRFSDVSKRNSVLMITSCLFGEASGSLAWGIAASAAADGRATVYINLDHQNHETINVHDTKRKPTPIERYLKDETFLVEVIQKIPNAPKLGFVEATGALRDPNRSLNSALLLELFAVIKRCGYDFIVLHAPPVLTSGDANWLSPFVDGAILSVTWGVTTENQMLDAVSQLRMNRAPLIGTAIVEVDPNIHKNHGYGGAVLTSDPVSIGNFPQIGTNEMIQR
jgi:uncharacterized protein involved in exopolysaccharide biosynthesis/Mrp family chromosome partitioning ATPase